MSSEPMTLYKLIILYVLDHVDFPLSNAQVSEFILTKGYTDYFTFQQAASELVDAEFIKSTQLRNSTHYTITDEGRETLAFFGKKISDGIKSDIDHYLKANKYMLRNENDVVADFYKEKTDEYIVRCEVKEKKSTLVELQLTVTDEAMAELICDNWKKKNGEVYQYLIQTLLQKK